VGTTEVINAGSTAWVLVSAALVMLMTPGLALFYGGLVRSKSVLNMMMMNLMCLGVVTVLWVVFGYSLVFGNDIGGGLLGGLDHVGLRDAATVVGPPSDRIPLLAFAMFQLMFAVITAALLAGAIADRAKFWSWTAFIVLWTCLVYFPLAHWVFSFNGYAAQTGGWIANQLKALDFAGGTVVEINSGASALALALILGKRRGWPKDPFRPHNMPNVLLGAGLLWFGWFGFNAGSALAVGAVAANAFTTTMTASAASLITWLIYEQFTDGRPTSLGVASGAIAGLVAITPGCGYVDTWGALVIGGLTLLMLAVVHSAANAQIPTVPSWVGNLLLQNSTITADPAMTAPEAQGLGQKFELLFSMVNAQDPQNPDNDVTALNTGPFVAFPGTPNGTIGVAVRNMVPGAKIATLTNQISLKYLFIPPRTCSGGSPRIQLFTVFKSIAVSYPYLGAYR